jgi:hypothetical protein
MQFDGCIQQNRTSQSCHSRAATHVRNQPKEDSSTSFPVARQWRNGGLYGLKHWAFAHAVSFPWQSVSQRWDPLRVGRTGDLK